MLGGKDIDTMDKNDKNQEEQLEEQIEEIKNEEDQSAQESGSKEIEQLQHKVVESDEKYKRALADYQNLERRTQVQKIEWIRSANKDLLLKMLPILDTLMLAVRHIDDKGLHISIDQFLKLLEQEGLTRIKTVGEAFDPYSMEAITTQEGENGKVLEEVRPGFMLNDSVLRTAQVIVGKAKD